MSDDPNKLAAQALNLPDTSREATALLAEAVRRTDMLADDDMGFSIRTQLINRCIGTGEWRYVMPAFAWCVERHDRDPERFAFQHLAWFTKWVIWLATDSPFFDEQTLRQLIADGERRYRAAGYPLRPIYRLQASAHNMLGDPEAALRMHAKFRATKRGPHSDCAACEASNEAEILWMAGRGQDALKILRRAVRDRYSCATQPEKIHAYLAWWTHATAPEEASIHAVKAERLYEHEGHFQEKSALLAYHAVTGAWQKVWDHIERELGHVLEEEHELGSLFWYAAVVAASDRRLAEDPVPPPVRTSLLAGFDVETPLEVLAGQLRARRDRLAAAFDARAGNTFVSRRIRSLAEPLQRRAPTSTDPTW